MTLFFGCATKPGNDLFFNFMVTVLLRNVEYNLPGAVLVKQMHGFK